MNRFYRMIAAAVLCLTAIVGTQSAASAQLGLPSVNDTLNRLPTRPIVDRLDRELEDKKKAAEELAAEAAETAEKMTAQAAGIVDGLPRPFILDRDPNGAIIEFNTIAVLVDSDSLDAITAKGFDVMSRRDLESLGLTLATLRNASGDTLPDAVQNLRNEYPDASIDFNHLYRFASESEVTPATDVSTKANSKTEGAVGDQMRIGIVDSEVRIDHRALRNVSIASRDFAVNEGLRPQTHGTAVASLVAGSAADNVTILAASVFFQVDGHAPGATSEGLVAALDWLASENVDVINMSLTGPGNMLLQKAIARMGETGPIVVAAIGNNGPSSEPLFPAAYAETIGVTAVDRDRKIFRYANHGEYVDFAALGVNVKIADSTTGGWRIESGTSMASPRVAVIVAKILSDGAKQESVTSWLLAGAEDLGRNGFDKVFGHGFLGQAPLIGSSN